MSELDPERNWTRHPGHVWREALIKSGRLQRDVAESAGISLKHLNAVLNGRGLLSVESVIRLSAVLRVSVKLMWHLQCDYVLDLALGKRDATHDSGGTDLS